MGAVSAGTRVVKSSGETETFDPNVITSECVEAGVEFWTAAEVALEVSNDVFDGINSEEIQRKVLGALYTRNPEVAERYKRFHSMYVRTSSNTIERFDRKRIVRSLVKETSLPKEVAEIIAREAEAELRRLNLEFTSGPLIREVANVKLLEHGYEGARSDYTRLGMPVYDAAQFIESAPAQTSHVKSARTVHYKMANSIFREYALLKVLPLHIADAHMKGELHIHDLEYFVTRPYTAFHDLRFFLRNGLRFEDPKSRGFATGPAKNATIALLHATKALMALSSNFSSSQGLHFFNAWLAPYLAGLEQKEISQAAQLFLFEISHIDAFSGHNAPPIDIEIEYGIPKALSHIPAVLPGGRIEEGITYADFEEEARSFARAITEAYVKGDDNGNGFRSPRLIYKLRKDDEKKESYNEFLHTVHEAATRQRVVHLLNLSTSHLGETTSAHSSGILIDPDERGIDNLKAGTMKLANLQCTTLNLPRTAYEAGGKDERLFEHIDKLLDIARQTARVKREVIEKHMSKGTLPTLPHGTDSKEYLELGRSTNLVSYVGLNEAIKTHIGFELHEDASAIDFGSSVLKHITSTFSEWEKDTGFRWLLTSEHPQSISRRFALLDSGQFARAVSTKGEIGSMDIHYTASCHITKEAGLSAIEKTKIESPFFSLNTGGMMETIEVERRGLDELLELSKEMLKIPAAHWSYVP